MWFSSRTTYMKKLLLLLLLIPQLAFADGIQLDGTTTLFYTTDTDYQFQWSATNRNIALGSYMQAQLWADEYGQQFCYDIQGPVALNDQGSNLEIFSWVGHTDISEIDIVISPTNAVDGNGCLNDSLDFTNSLNASSLSQYIVGGLPAASSTETAGTSTDAVVNNPTLDWFLGFLIFFICMVFPIWLFRRK